TMHRLTVYSWPGNIRELQNVIERGVVLSAGSVLTLAEDLTPAKSNSTSTAPVRMEEKNTAPVSAGSLEDVERQHIESVLRQTNWMIEGERGAAKILELNPSTLRSRMQKLDIKRPGR